MESWSPVTHPVKQQTGMPSWLRLLGAPDSGSLATRTQPLDAGNSGFLAEADLGGNGQRLLRMWGKGLNNWNASSCLGYPFGLAPWAPGLPSNMQHIAFGH